MAGQAGGTLIVRNPGGTVNVGPVSEATINYQLGERKQLRDRTGSDQEPVCADTSRMTNVPRFLGGL